jgi:hypothetical protein
MDSKITETYVFCSKKTPLIWWNNSYEFLDYYQEGLSYVLGIEDRIYSEICHGGNFDPQLFGYSIDASIFKNVIIKEPTDILTNFK